MLIVVLALALIALWLLLRLMTRRKPNFPPGPPSLPLIGSLPFFKKDFRRTLECWRRTYGSVVGLRLGPTWTVVVSDFELMKKAFGDPRFSGRPQPLREIMADFSDCKKDNAGVVFSQGHVWRQQRRFVVKTLRDLGFDKTRMQDVMLREVEHVVSALSSHLSSSSSSMSLSSSQLNTALGASVVNTLWSVMTGERLTMTSEQIESITEGLNAFIRDETLNGLLMIFPKLRHWPYFKQRFRASKTLTAPLRELQTKVIEEKKRESGEKRSPNFVNIYLDQMRKQEHEKMDVEMTSFDDSNLFVCMSELFGSGHETSVSTLMLSILYMIRHPSIQSRVQMEIDRVLEANKRDHVVLDDRHNMHYVNAVLHETLRHSCLVYTVPHATTEEVKLGDFVLPAQTTVYANVFHVMNDESYWHTPRVFDPMRFLQEVEGDHSCQSESNLRFTPDERCVPFMLGKRACPGQKLAQNQLFIFFVTLMRNFHFEDNEEVHANQEVEPLVGFLHRCPDFSFKLSKRHQ